MYFGSVRLGKAYVSFHLMPLYMTPELTDTISPALKKRMQGKTCFNFKTDPDPEAAAELKRLTEAGIELWRREKVVIITQAGGDSGSEFDISKRPSPLGVCCRRGDV